MSVPSDLSNIIATMHYRIGELERRFQNKERTGIVVEADYEKGLYRVQLLEKDKTGKPYLTPWIPRRETAAGSNKTHYPLSIGEQVCVISQSGDLSDAEISHSLACSCNPRPSNKGDEYILSQVGPFELRVSDGGQTAFIKVGNTSLKMTEGKFEVRAPDVEFIKS